LVRQRYRTPEFLVVADDESTAHTLSEVCARYGTCTISDSPAAALSVLHGASRPITGLIVERELRSGSTVDLAAYARRQLQIPTLMLSAQNTHRSVHEAYHIGATYLCKPVEAPELELFVSAAAALGRSAADLKNGVVAGLSRRAGLTPREAEVVQRALENVPRSAMAEAMGISESTLKFHIRALLDKTDARNLSELVRGLLLQLSDGAPP
jgi:DNA-binding NarL/FixJ family response regulator